MSDERHRGRHPKDAALFAAAALPALRAAVADLSWLRGRGYGDDGAIKTAGTCWSPARARCRVLAACGDVAATSDSWILDRAPAWCDLPAAVIAARGAGAWLLEL